jgi:hypothetical protein
MSDVEFAIREIVRHARGLPLADAIRLLTGFVLLAGDIQEVHALRAALIPLQASDAQLELIASGQLKLNLASPTGSTPTKKNTAPSRSTSPASWPSAAATSPTSTRITTAGGLPIT